MIHTTLNLLKNMFINSRCKVSTFLWISHMVFYNNRRIIFN